MAEERALSLPPALEPWRIWLSLLPPDLLEPVAALLLRLHPLVGRLNSTSLQNDDTPQGVGNIVRRGLYERMLISEWAMLDTEPQEFLRRVANHELLFTGPEPAARRSAQRCVVLFDCGPAQIGEPRIAHLALFILLVRRALEAGAEFQWGCLQVPAQLHSEHGLSGLQRLIKSRTATPANDTHIQQWNDTFAEMGSSLRDCWQIGAGGSVATVARMSARLAIELPWHHAGLQVELIQRHTARSIQLELPEPRIAIRLLRDPFVPLASPARQRDASGKPSLQQAPHFAINGDWLLVPLVDGSNAMYNIPRSPNAAPGRVHHHRRPAHGSILSAMVVKKSFCMLISLNDQLRLAGFPGNLSQNNNLVERPPVDQLRAPPGLARWLPMFYLKSNKLERILLIDIEQRLVCWEYRPGTKTTEQKNGSFSVIASNVIGATQSNETLRFACQEEDEIRFYSWGGWNNSPTQTFSMPGRSKRVLFTGPVAPQCEPTVAVQQSENQWRIGNHKAEQTLQVGHHAIVIGVVDTDKNGSAGAGEPGLLLLSADKKSIQFQTGSDCHTLFFSPGPIVNPVFDPLSARLAWLTTAPPALKVHNLTDKTPLLYVHFSGEAHAA